ncbi:MAG TPA: ABC transporter substrate-binding protein [Roseiflexaceae bacterium]|nr:ABC transporter substrate-binding protein [Roseiflexaceae bacterium]
MLGRLSVLLAVLVLLAACGGTVAQPPTATPAASPVASPAASPAVAQPSAAPAGPVVVNHFKGELRLDAPATRVVACGDEAVDLVLALGVQPVGLCSARANATAGERFAPAAYFFPADQLGAPTFVGSSLEPSIERIATLKPDLIVIISDSNDAYDQLSQVAPTFYVDMESPGYWRDTLGQLGLALGRAAEAEQFLADYDRTVAEVKQRVAPVVAQRPNALAIYSFSPDPQMMVFKPGTWLSKGLEQLGFSVSTPSGVTFADNDWSIVSTEYLSEVKAELIVVLRSPGPDGAMPTFPMDALLERLEAAGSRVVFQPLDPTRASSAPLTDRFVIEQYSALLPEAAPATSQIDPTIFTREPSVRVVAQEGGKRTVAHTQGETTIPAEPQRIVVLDETLADSLLALGITPVASTTYYGIEGFSAHLAPLLDPATRLGQYGSPSLERIAALQPDLILSDSYTAEETYDQLSGIAPTVVFADEYTYPLLRAVARTMGREQAADARIAAYERKAAEARAALQQATAGKRVALLRIFGTELLVEGGIGYTGPVLWQALGLTPHRLVNPDKWNEKFSLELLPELDADILLLMPEINGAETARAMQKNPLWQGLPAVKSGNVYTLEGYSHWLTYGILANERAIDDVLATLGPQAGR